MDLSKPEIAGANFRPAKFQSGIELYAASLTMEAAGGHAAFAVALYDLRNE